MVYIFNDLENECVWERIQKRKEKERTTYIPTRTNQDSFVFMCEVIWAIVLITPRNKEPSRLTSSGISFIINTAGRTGSWRILKIRNRSRRSFNKRKDMNSLNSFYLSSRSTDYIYIINRKYFCRPLLLHRNLVSEIEGKWLHELHLGRFSDTPSN